MTILRYRADRRTLGVVGGWYALLASAWVVDPHGLWANVPLVAAHLDPRLDEPSMFAYVFRNYLRPGGRRNFDGTTRERRDPGPDESWITEEGPIPATAMALPHRSEV